MNDCFEDSVQTEAVLAGNLTDYGFAGAGGVTQGFGAVPFGGGVHGGRFVQPGAGNCGVVPGSCGVVPGS